MSVEPVVIPQVSICIEIPSTMINIELSVHESILYIFIEMVA
jgi:hypothetical protein